MSRIEEFVRPYRVTRGKGFRLADFDPRDTGSLKADKKKASALLEKGVAELARLQDMLYAQDRWSILVIFQAMDAAGKDGAIKHVMSGLNPQGCQVFSFKVPSAEELDHDFLWRTTKCLPERGRIGIFNRSYYEEVLVVKVHREILAQQRLPESLVTEGIWKERYQSIADFERHLARNGTVLVKLFLNISRREQERRFLARLDRPEKNWKFSAADVKERHFWKSYMSAYEDAIRATATSWAPWYIVPAENKWFSRLVVAEAIIAAMKKLSLTYPEVTADQRRELKKARAELEAE
jgi:PPK2 family polyphosphate:nucleotide phosphotransferase